MGPCSQRQITTELTSDIVYLTAFLASDRNQTVETLVDKILQTPVGGKCD